MENNYNTIINNSKFKFKIKKSIFIGHSYKASNIDDINSIISQINEEYNDATHNCRAYKLGFKKNKVKYNGDGEPSGTAGKPILNVIQQNNLTNILIIVTRYFGGIKLGAGGLIRAYTKASQKVIEKSEIRKFKKYNIFKLNIDYNKYEKLKNFFINNSIKIINSDFKKNISLKIAVPEKNNKKLKNYFKNLTKNKYQPKFIETKII